MNDNRLTQLQQQIRQLRRILTELTPPLEVLLRRKGFIVFKKEAAETLLLPDREFLDQYYELLKRYAFRLFLRDVIKYADGFEVSDVTSYATPEVTRDYIDALLRMGMVEDKHGVFRLTKSGLISFGETLEWFVAEILKRQYQMEVMWGVRFRGRSVGGDYDVLAKLNGGIMYIEIKSSPPRQIYDRDVTAFLHRVEDLCPDMAVFFVDTHLRMKDKIVPLFEEALSKSPLQGPIHRIKTELFSINKWIFIINSKPSIEANIDSVLSYYLNRRCK